MCTICSSRNAYKNKEYVHQYTYFLSEKKSEVLSEKKILSILIFISIHIDTLVLQDLQTSKCKI